jgi:DNA-binding transcriptional ArsR family regulator
MGLWNSLRPFLQPDGAAQLMVLHNPTKFGLRGAWAAGVRSRLPQDIRDFFEDSINYVAWPYCWVHNLPQPKDSSTVLYELKRIPAKDRLEKILPLEFAKGGVIENFLRVKETGVWTEADRDLIIDALKQCKSQREAMKRYTPQYIEKVLSLFVEAEEFGNKYLEALEVYVRVFFAEEEKRIAERLESKKELLSKLSRGIEFETLPDAKVLVMTPSFWISPLIVTMTLDDPGKVLWVFGAREQGEAIVPGETVPEDLTKTLKAISDPTRLRILRILMREQTTPAELSRRLRLRAPTVTHHLQSLRLAGLVRFVLRGKQERIYFSNMDAVKSLYAQLKDFLEDDKEDYEPPDRINTSRVL